MLDKFSTDNCYGEKKNFIKFTYLEGTLQQQQKFVLLEVVLLFCFFFLFSFLYHDRCSTFASDANTNEYPIRTST